MDKLSTYDGLFGWLVSLACVEHKHCLRGVFDSAPSLERTNGSFYFSFLCQAVFSRESSDRLALEW